MQRRLDTHSADLAQSLRDASPSVRRTACAVAVETAAHVAGFEDANLEVALAAIRDARPDQDLERHFTLLSEAFDERYFEAEGRKDAAASRAFFGKARAAAAVALAVAANVEWDEVLYEAVQVEAAGSPSVEQAVKTALAGGVRDSA